LDRPPRHASGSLHASSAVAANALGPVGSTQGVVVASVVVASVVVASVVVASVAVASVVNVASVFVASVEKPVAPGT
jgi:hypothetical protein